MSAWAEPKIAALNEDIAEIEADLQRAYYPSGPVASEERRRERIRLLEGMLADRRAKVSRLEGEQA